MPTIKDLTKSGPGSTNWITGNERPTTDDLKLSCLMRIADAAEQTAKNYVALQSDRDTYKRWYKEQNELIAKLIRKLTATRGVVTRLKNQMSQMQKENLENEK